MIDGAKLAALRLSELSKKDKQWVLAQLNKTEKRQIDEALTQVSRLGGASELGESGIPFSDVLSGLNGSLAELDALAEKNAETKVEIGGINVYDFETVVKHLDALPEPLIVTFLESKLWNETEQYVDALGSAKRKSFEAIAEQKSRTVSSRVNVGVTDLLIEMINSEGVW